MSRVATIVKRIPYHDRYALIVPDMAAGTKGRYTVYSIPSSPSRRVRVIGRELTLGQARRIAGKATGAVPRGTKGEKVVLKRSEWWGPLYMAG